MKNIKALVAAAGVIALAAGGITGLVAQGIGLFPGLPAQTTVTGAETIPADTNATSGNVSVLITADQLAQRAGDATPRIRYTTVPIGSVAFAGFGNDTTYVAGTTYYALISIPRAMTITGVSCMNGATVGTDKVITALYDSDGGAAVANSAVAGTTTSGADAFQDIAFTATYAATMGNYYVAIQGNGTTDNVKTVAASTFVDVTTDSDTGTFGTLGTLTVPTTFTANVGPICAVY